MSEYHAVSRSDIVHLPNNLTKLAIHNCDNEQNKNCNDRDGYNPIRSHSVCSSVTSSLQWPKFKEEIPTRHPPQRFHAPIHISLTLQDCDPRTLYLLALHLQIR